MSERKKLKRGIICICLVAIELLLYFGISRHIAIVKAEEAAEEARYFRTNSEFLRTIDCAKLFDAYPGYSFELKFEICAEKAGEVVVYQQNGSGHRYTFAENIDVTEEFQEFCLIVKPVLTDEEEEESFLTFYGFHEDGVIPTVRDISIVPIE